MTKWRYSAYLPKPPHHMTQNEWQIYIQNLTKNQKSERYSGITSDLISTFEMIEAQGAGGIIPDPNKRTGRRGQADSFAPGVSRGSVPDLYGNPELSGETQQEYGLAGKIIGAGRGAIKVVRKAGEVMDDTLGTREDPTAIRLGLEWLTGKGPRERRLGEGSRFVREFQKSNGIRLARDKLYFDHNGYLEDGDSLLDYPVKFTFKAAWEARTAAEHFIGSYIVDLKVKGRLIHFEARNTSGLESLTAGRLRSEIGLWPDWPTKESGPGSNKYQVLTWTEPVVERGLGDFPIDPTPYG